MSEASAVLVGDFVYAGGGSCKDYDTGCTIFRYSSENDVWGSLQKLDRQKFALASYRDELVVIGGETPKRMPLQSAEYHNSLRIWDKNTWKESYPAMKTPRMQPSAVGYGDHLIVAGGKNKDPLDSVEVFSGRNNQWYSAFTTMPAKIYSATSTVFEESWYIMGGSGQKKAVYQVRLDSLISEATGSGPNTMWQSLPDTEFESAAITVFGNCILAIGGIRSRTVANFLGITDAVRGYFPGRKMWLPIEKPLPFKFYTMAAVIGPSNELIVIGGHGNWGPTKCVYRGYLRHDS